MAIYMGYVQYFLNFVIVVRLFRDSSGIGQLLGRRMVIETK